MNEKEAKILWLDFLKSLTRSLVQINLYNPEHPQVKEAAGETLSILGKILSSTDRLTLSMSGEKLLVNNIPLLGPDKIPNSIRNVFTKFNLRSITFLRDLSAEELVNFCKAQHSKIPLSAFIKETGLKNILLNEDIYQKVSEEKRTSSPQRKEENITAEIYAMDLKSSIDSIVGKIARSGEERRNLTNLILRKVHEETRAKIKEVVEKYTREKRRAENDAYRTQAVMSSIADGVVVVNNEGKIVMMNEDAQAISGKSLKEVAGKTIFDISDLENQVLTLAREIKEEDKKELSKEVLSKGKNDLSKTIRKSSAIIQNEEGKIVGAMSIPSDKAKLKETETLKKEFVANVTHELRSPLTSIRASLEMLASRKDLDEPGKKVLDTAIRNSERLNTLINDILDFSKIESGKIVFHPNAENPSDLLNEAYESMSAWAESKKLNFTQNITEDLPQIYADKTRTVQMLINLISNAIKFTPGGGSVELSACRDKKEPSNYITFSIKDTGCGIKEKDQKKIFDKFVQVASGEKTGGTGIGLSLVKAMAIMQGGKISLESAEGRGSVFKVSLPIYKRFKAETEEKKTAKKPWWRKIFGI